MMIKKIIGLLLSCMCLCACTEDPTFVPEEENVSVSVYVGNVGYTYADVYCQISSNVNLVSVVLELSSFMDMKQAESYQMKKTTEYPIAADFDKTHIVFKTNLTNLKNGSTYYGRIIVETTIGGHYEKEGIVFNTESLGSSGITTKSATDISFTYATLNGQVVSASDVKVSETGFFYSQNSNMENAISVAGDRYYGSFKATINNLEPNTTYYYQAYAVMNGETYRGEKMTFLTDEYTYPDVHTGVFSDVTYNSVKCAMTIKRLGNTSVKEWGILYGLNTNLTIDNAKKVSYTSSPTVGKEEVVKISKLEGGGLYHYRAFATNTAGTAYGDEWFFLTDDAPEIQVKSLPVYTTSYTYAYAQLSIKTYGQNVIEYGVIYDEDYRLYSLYLDDGHPVAKVTVNDWAGINKSWTTTIRLSNLTEGTDYQYRAYVKYKIPGGEDELEVYGDDYIQFETRSH